MLDNYFNIPTISKGLLHLTMHKQPKQKDKYETINGVYRLEKNNVVHFF